MACPPVPSFPRTTPSATLPGTDSDRRRRCRLPPYRCAVDDTVLDGHRGTNDAAIAALLLDLDAPNGDPGFVTDSLIGRELAATVAGWQSLRLLAEATFHDGDAIDRATPPASTTTRRRWHQGSSPDCQGGLVRRDGSLREAN